MSPQQPPYWICAMLLTVSLPHVQIPSCIVSPRNTIDSKTYWASQFESFLFYLTTVHNFSGCPPKIKIVKPSSKGKAEHSPIYVFKSMVFNHRSSASVPSKAHAVGSQKETRETKSEEFQDHFLRTDHPWQNLIMESKFNKPFAHVFLT